MYYIKKCQRSPWFRLNVACKYARSKTQIFLVQISFCSWCEASTTSYVRRSCRHLDSRLSCSFRLVQASSQISWTARCRLPLAPLIGSDPEKQLDLGRRPWSVGSRLHSLVLAPRHPAFACLLLTACCAVCKLVSLSDRRPWSLLSPHGPYQVHPSCLDARSSLSVFVAGSLYHTQLLRGIMFWILW